MKDCAKRTIHFLPRSLEQPSNVMGPLDVDSERKGMDAGPSDESTITARTEKENETGDNTSEERTAESPVTSEYPHGFRLVIVLLAIIFCVLLLALDQVSI